MFQAQVKFKTDPVQRVDGLTKTLQKRVILRAIGDALPPVVEAMRGAVPIRYGFLQQSISKKTKAYRTACIGMVGVKSKFKKTKGKRTRGKHEGEPITFRPSWYAHLVDKGSKHNRATHFLQETLDRTSGQYLATVRDNIGREIEAELKKE